MNPIIEVKQGKIKGKTVKSIHGKEYYYFLGIPYAEPPVGDIRFRDPISKKKWEGIRDATRESNCSPQIIAFTTNYKGSDDCLYLNVATPKLKSPDGSKLPVMVNIHGGAFISGSGSEFGPDYIVEQDTILVTFNYRLGVIGFLCTDSINARGDMGLKDQNLALKWVKENIESFGGDSNNITLFGISAGSASVEYQMMSPLSRGLFSKAILQSGSAMNSWARTRGGIQLALKLAKSLGYCSNNTDELFDFINEFDSKDLIMATAKSLNNSDLIEGKLFSFVPVINELKDYNGFLNEEPYQILKKGNFAKVPTINGFCEYDGMLTLFIYSREAKNDLKYGRYIKYIPSYINKNIENLDERLKSIYNEKKILKNSNDHLMNFLSDQCFTSGIFYSLDQKLIHNPDNNYFYHFKYDGNINYFKHLLKISERGACHADETTYLFIDKRIDKPPTPTDEMVRDKIVKLWTNFAKTSNPTPDSCNPIEEKWLPVTKTEFNYLEIDSKIKVLLNTELIPERRELWRKLYKKTF